MIQLERDSMKIAICDDDKLFLKQLHEYIRQYAAKYMLDYTILEFDRGDLLLNAVRHDPEIRILFLDIYMTPLSGMDLAETLRADGNSCAVIFVTVSTDHYAKSYEVDAEHYLVKPITYEQVQQALARCGKLLESAAKCASFLCGGKALQIPLHKIRFVEVFRNEIVIHADSDISLRCSLDAAMRQLSDQRFLRTHRSFLVNMEYISARSGSDLLLKTGDRVPLSRTCKHTFEREYGRYLTVSMTGEPL